MAEYKASFIKVPTDVAGFQTLPTEPQNRIPSSDIRIELCKENDADKIAEGMYASFPETFWAKMEPRPGRELDQAIRQRRMAARLRPTFHNTKLRWIKAIYTPTSQIVGVAGWMAPGNPPHNPLRHSAFEFYGWKKLLNLTDEDVNEMWKGTSLEVWDSEIGSKDDLREDIMKGEEHWHLAPLLTLPEFQGKGIGSRLLKWAFEQADATEPKTPLYLESAPTARAVYMHHGFVPLGEVNMVRRGPRVVKGLEAEEESGKEAQ